MCLHFLLLGYLLLGCTELVITRRFGVLPFPPPSPPFPLLTLARRQRTTSILSLGPLIMQMSPNTALLHRGSCGGGVCRTGTRKLAGHILKYTADAPAGGGLLADEGNLSIQGADAASAHHSCRSSGHTSSIPSPPPTPAPRPPPLHVWLTT